MSIQIKSPSFCSLLSSEEKIIAGVWFTYTCGPEVAYPRKHEVHRKHGPGTVQLRLRTPGAPSGRPPESSPRGLALIAHGRFGNKDQPVVRKLAEYLREERRLRVVTWDDLAVWNGRDFHADWTIWIGDVAQNHYNHFLYQAMDHFKNEFPDVEHPELFICGYSAGAIAAGCARPSASLVSHFATARYVLVSYPVETNPIIGIFKAGSNFRSVEGLLQGHGWEGLPAEFNGTEPEVAGVLTITGSNDRGPFFWLWSDILWGKNSRGKLSQVIIDGANHTWDNMECRLVDGVRDWLT